MMTTKMAPGMEAATRGRIGETGYLALQDDAFAAAVGVGYGRGGE